MPFTTVWTKQSKKILDVLEAKGRYIVKEEYIREKMEDHSELYLNCYNWLRIKTSQIMDLPKDASYPIWVSMSKEESIPNDENDGTVLLELEVENNSLCTFDLEKWGAIVNYQYIPKDLDDLKKHEEKLEKMGLSDDTSAYMSPFYPHLKKEIEDSWMRLFDDSIRLSDINVSILWEVKKEWIQMIKK